MAHLGFRGRKENWKYEEGDKNKNTRLRVRGLMAQLSVLCSGEGQWGWGKEEHPQVASHLWEARSEPAGFCSVSAAGQQNWCSTVSFLRAEQRKKVRVRGGRLTPRHFCPETLPVCHQSGRH